MDKSMRRSLGIINEEEQKEQQAYQNVLNFLKIEKSQIHEKGYSQKNILEQIENFHRYYNQKCQQYKQQYEKLSQQNWDYTSKIIKYEQAIENYQLMLFETKQQLMYTSDKYSQLQKHNQKNTQQYAQAINKKDKEINDLRSQLLKIMVKHEVPKKKVVKLKQKNSSSKFDSEDTFNLESARSNRQLCLLKQQLECHSQEIIELHKQNDALRKKIKHLQIDRKYEDDRLKNATLTLQLDLKIKNQQIERLNNQIQIYENKFEELISNFKSKNFISPTTSTNPITPITQPLSTKNGSKCNQKKLFLSSKHYENLKNIEASLNISLEENDIQKTHRKVNLETDRTQKKLTHKRTGSSNLQQNRASHDKQELDMKIKVYKFGKQKKYP